MAEIIPQQQPFQLVKHLDWVPANGEEVKAWSLLSPGEGDARHHGLELVHGGLSGAVHYTYFSNLATPEDPESMHVDSSDDPQAIWGTVTSSVWKLVYSFEIGKESFALTSVSSNVSSGTALVLVGGLGKEVAVFGRKSVRSEWTLIGVLPTTQPTYTTSIRIDGRSTKRDALAVDATLFFAGADKHVHQVSAAIGLSDSAPATMTIASHRIYKGHSSCVRAFSLNSFNTRSNMSSMASVSDDGSCRVWPLTTHTSTPEVLETLATFHSHSNDVIAVDYKNDIIVTGGKDTKVVLFDTAPMALKAKGESTNVQIASIANHAVATSLSDDTSLVLAGSGDGKVRVYRRNTSFVPKKGTPLYTQQWDLVSSIPIFPNQAIKQMFVSNNYLIVSSADGSQSIFKITT